MPNKIPPNKSNKESIFRSSGKSDKTHQFANMRPQAIAQRQRQQMVNKSPQVNKLEVFQKIADGNSSLVQKKANKTGLPDNLKTGMENLSGISLDDVKVHRNSDKPAQLQAHAYAQGTDIHVGPGQEKHLPHEAWHVVQQKQGRVKPTMQLKGQVAINDDQGLEKEADEMGSKALQRHTSTQLKKASAIGIVQRMKVFPEKGYKQKLGNQKSVINKLDKLIAIMGTALSPVFPSDSMRVEIINDGEITPAWNHPKGTNSRPGKLGNIGVEFNRWYLERVSLGALVGMFIHEVGVHTFADKLMGAEVQKGGGVKADGGSGYADEYHDQGKDHKNQIGGTIEKYPNAIEDPKNKKKGRSRQRDHVNLAKSLAGGKSTRSDHYISLYLHTGDAIDKEMKGKEKNTTLKELTQSFLFDLGRLAATDDGGAASLFWNTGNIGQLMVYYQKKILKPEEDSHKWLKAAALNIKSGKWQLRGYLLSQLGSLAISSNPAVQTTRSGLAGLVAGGVVLATGASLATAAAPALATAVVVGGGVHLLQKLFGY